MITTFPAVLNSGVMPSERPTVPKAEETSNKISVREKADSMHSRMTTATLHRIIPVVKTMNDLMI